jgi:hypothetical protein
VIEKYYSPVGNSAVPYPYAVGQKYVYLMLDNEYEPVEDFDLTKEFEDEKRQRQILGRVDVFHPVNFYYVYACSKCGKVYSVIEKFKGKIETQVGIGGNF